MLAVAALMILVGLVALVVTDAGSASELAWLGAGTAAALLAAGMAAGSPGPVHAAVLLLGAIFLARHDLRLLLAPLYGAGLLQLEALATRTIELRGVALIAPEAIWSRTAATLLVAAVGACVAAAAALVVTVGPGRSVALTAAGAIAAVGAFAAIARFARGRYRRSE
ncbi:MAG TPA: hypothetical protein VMF57_07050 [Solirubrobacteraceae bacterium]|nr:hypothetical protein [Solirubrobacteraceae bacterium]